MHPLLRRPAPIDVVISPFQRFAQIAASGGIVLIIFTIVALVWANSPESASYHALWQMPLSIGIGEWAISKAIILWINDGLMAIFFFVVGLEIKRELIAGELASLKKASLPIAAAVGGMVVPALIYTAVNAGLPSASGWGVPMATDIAFALGILSLAGNRVPLSLKVFLTAVAIVDDIGAVLVIALFYTSEIIPVALLVSGVALALMVVLNVTGVRRTVPYLVLGFILWFAMLKSGVHATLAGVLAAFTIPARSCLNPEEFMQAGQDTLKAFNECSIGGGNVLANCQQAHVLHELELCAKRAGTPLQSLEHALHPWVAYAIMPIFALANAGVTIEGDVFAALAQPVSLGTIGGLLLGKQIGICLAVWVSIKMGLGKLPSDITPAMMYALSWLAGIGFTMSIFIGGLAFGDAIELTNAAKLGILFASTVAGTGGFIVLQRALNRA